MAKIHVLTSGSVNNYVVAVHAPTPAGNNLAGFLWSDVLKNSGRAKSILTVGTGVGQISNAEMNQISNGAIIEGVLNWDDDPAWTQPQRLADLEARANILIAELLARYNQELKYFGFTTGT